MQWLASRIPPVSPRELGVFRVLFGAALIWLVYDMRLPAQPFPVEFHLRSHRLADWGWVHDLAAQPDRVVLLEYVAMALAGLFAIGLATRLSYTALVLALTAWTLVRLTHTGAHNWSAMFITLWAMLPVRWGDGFSVDRPIARLLERPRPLSQRTASYGYGLWIPGLTFGAAMAGAGYAKLIQGGLAWITNGSVKYHFVADAAHAPTDWGLWVASHPTMAVLLSGVAIVTELSLVLAVLVPSYRWRLPFALAGLGLLVGFYAFQNEWWWAWWTLYLAFFVPWPHLVRLMVPAAANNDASEPRPRLRWSQTACVLAVCGLQITASALRIERAPIASDYPMYSTTYAAIADFEKQRPGETNYHFDVRFRDGTRQAASTVFEDLGLDEAVRDAFAGIRDGNEGAVAAAKPVIAAAAKRLAEHYGEPVTAITVLLDERAFDWGPASSIGDTSASRYTFDIE